MKLLLTSNGITNPAIAKALFDLVGKPASEITAAFIPTAANVIDGDKRWLIDSIVDIQHAGIASLDIVDISALSKDIWQPRLEAVDVLIFSGGNNAYLMKWIVESGLESLLPKLLHTKVWVGISAGSCITSPTLVLSNKDDQIYSEEVFGYDSNKGLGFVDFYFRSHFNSPDFPNMNKEYLNEVAEEVSQKIYALDDNSALKVVDGQVEVISEGEYEVFN